MAAKKRTSGPSGKSQPEKARTNKLVGIRLPPAELAELRERCDRHDVSPSSVIRLAWTIAMRDGMLDAALEEASRWGAVLSRG